VQAILFLLKLLLVGAAFALLGPAVGVCLLIVVVMA